MTKNPFTPASSTLFYGREGLMRSLLRDEAQGQSVLFIGGRRCGKTRTLERLEWILRARCAGEDAAAAWSRAVPDAADPTPPGNAVPRWPLPVNCEGLEEIKRGLGEFLGFVCRTAVESEPPADDLPDVPATEAGTDAFLRWLESFDRVLDRAGFGGMALLIDEIERLFDAPWHHELMRFLRRIDGTTFRTRCWIVLAGSDGLDTYTDPEDGSPPLNLLRRAWLEDLDYTARRRMVCEPFVEAGKLPPSDAVLREVDLAAAGNAWILTHLLEHVFEAGGDALPSLRSFEDEFLNLNSSDFQRWARPIASIEDGVAWGLYQAVASAGALERAVLGEHVRGAKARAALNLLRYQSLVHRRADEGIEVGPELFRRFAEEEGDAKKPFGTRSAGAADGEPLPPGHYRYDVALSYTNPQRGVAQELAGELASLKLKVFYDRRVGHDLWGADLERTLPRVYDREARLTLLLVSEDYAESYWPLVEAKAALVKAVREGWSGVLPVSLDGTRLTEFPASVVWLDLPQEGAQVQTVALRAQQRLLDIAGPGSGD